MVRRRAAKLRCRSSCLTAGVLLTTIVLVEPWAHGSLMKAEGAWLFSERGEPAALRLHGWSYPAKRWRVIVC